MAHRIIKAFILGIILSPLAFMPSCYYDKAEEMGQTGPCDTTKVTFSLTVHPIIQSNCEGCHSGATAGGGVQLTNYTEIQAAASSGTLMGTIKHQPGYSAMPKGGNKLSDCQIRQMDLWIAQGMKNN